MKWVEVWCHAQKNLKWGYVDGTMHFMKADFKGARQHIWHCEILGILATQLQTVSRFQKGTTANHVTWGGDGTATAVCAAAMASCGELDTGVVGGVEASCHSTSIILTWNTSSSKTSFPQQLAIQQCYYYAALIMYQPIHWLLFPSTCT